jgi:hypothetical protein
VSTFAGLKPYWNFRTLLLSGDAVHQLAVNTGNGNLVVSATDFVFAARIPAVLLRTYNSSDTAGGSLGPGWRMGWDESITPYSSTGDLTYTDPSGTEYFYDNTGTDTWVHPAGIFSTLSYEATPDELWLTAPDGFVRVFDGTSGRLLRYADPRLSWRASSLSAEQKASCW